jgi:hypothetical protein
VRLHSCRFDSGSGYKGLQWCKPFLFFRAYAYSPPTRSTKFCSSIRWTVVCKRLSAGLDFPAERFDCG